MKATGQDEGLYLASIDPKEFDANALAVAMMRFNEVGALVEGGYYEAQGFADMLKVSIAQLEAKAATQRAALAQVEIALESVSHSTPKR